MAQKWTLESIDWDQFDATKLSPTLLAVVKAAALVEANSADYVTYLCNVFSHDEAFKDAARQWGVEEAQHGAALGRWAEIADPSFSFEESLALFRKGYSLPLGAEQSVRGSHAGELIARCVVESGTSSFYSAIRDASEEPVLKEVCRRIAIDEFFHYQLFQKHLQRYKSGDKLSLWERLKVAIGRVQEAEDDELSYAWFAANVLPKNPDAVYNTGDNATAYWRGAMSLYQRPHIENAARMILRAADFNPNGRFANLAAGASWHFVRWRRDRLAKAA
ncbi:hypothetical protein GCM10007972_05830 [Iodidimonas muriae]|uniref:Ferritin-like domain-containing protein n=1 Tax=Iodidimonas muriae TaxID=261467 RepID=A0ABQ2L8P6_9PROT|nr:ferritin-like domain-containing protein [Iodidimonas muriae]GER05814.1 hypothetical protein JCM17843_01240 [Kordiimonadales bacterium JCM 17843]GGO06988.1 hypothetical protein GCM10007972_05830 [Iodidimonas muriae]